MADFQKLRGVGAVALGALQGSDDQNFFQLGGEFFDRELLAGEDLVDRVCGLADRLGERVEINFGTGAKDHSSLDTVLKFPDIARPVVSEKSAQRCLGDARDGGAEALVLDFNEVFDQQGDVFGAFTKGREVDGDDMEPIEEILTEGPFTNPGLEIVVGGGDDSDIDGMSGGGAEGADLTILENAEQFYLQFQGKIGDFVEEESPAVGDGKEAGSVGSGVGEGPTDMAKELALQKRGRDGSAVDGHEGTGTPGGKFVEGSGGELFSGPTFAGEEDRGFEGGDFFEHREDGFHRGTLADDSLKGLVALDLRAEGGIFALQSQTFQSFDHRQEDLIFLKGLIDVVVSSALEGFDGEVTASESAHDDDRGVELSLLEFFEKFESTDSWHPDIGEDEIIRSAEEFFEPLFAIGDGAHLPALGAKEQGEHMADALFVVDDQNLGFIHRKYQSGEKG